MSDTTDRMKKQPKPRRNWRRRLRILVLVVLIGACLFRIALNVLLPTVLDKVAGVFGLECGYQRLDLSLLGGKAHIWGLELRPKEGGDLIARCEYIEGNLSPLNLLRGRLVVYRAEVDGVEVQIERAADGSLPLLQKILAARSTAAPAKATPTGPPRPFNLDAPLQVDAVRLSHVTAKLRDKSVTPNFEAAVRTNLRISDVGAVNQPAHFELDVAIDPLLDTLRIAGEARTSPTELKADVQLLLRGLHPKAAAGYLSQLGLTAVAETVTVQANLSLQAKTIPGTADVAATVSLDHVSAITDGQQWASLDTLSLEAKRVNAARAELGKLVIADGFASADRTAAGGLRVAGLELASAAAGPTQAPAASVQAPVALATPAVTVTAGPAFRLSLDEIDVQRLQATITDAAVQPALKLVARLDSLSLKDIDTDPSAAGRPVIVSLAASVPGVVTRATALGTVTPFDTTKRVRLALGAEGVRPDALRPYLDPVGIVSRLKDGRFAADVAATVSTDASGKITADASATGVRFTDGDVPLLAMAYAGVDQAQYTPADGSIAVRSIGLSGPVLSAARAEDGHIEVAGFKVVPPAATPPQPVGPAAAPAPALTPSTVKAALPRIAIGHFRWDGARLTLEDRVAASATKLVLDDVGVQLDDLLIDLRSTAAARPGKFYAWLAAPQLARSLVVGGVFTPGVGRFTLEAEATGDGLTGRPLAPYLKGLGVEPTLADGRLNGKAKLDLTDTPAGPAIELNLNDVRYADGDIELAGLDSFTLAGLSVTPTRVDVGELSVNRPRVRVARGADGALSAGGVRLVPVVAAPTPMPAATRPAEPTPLRLTRFPIDFGLKTLRVNDATIDWTDDAAAMPVAVHALATVALDSVDTAPDAGPATLRLSAGVDDLLKFVTVDGEIRMSPESPSAKLAIVADGLRAGPLASYLPPTIESTLIDGHFEAAIDVGVSNHADGGLVARLSADKLTFTDDAERVPLAKVDAFVLTAPRLDPAANVFAIGELSSSGVAAVVRQSPAGLEALGIRLRDASSAATPEGASAPAAAPTTIPDAAPTTAPATPVASLASAVQDARRPLPRVTVDRLDLNLSELTLDGFTGPDAAPVVVSDLRVASPDPIRFGGRQAENDPPLRIDIGGAVQPLVNRFDVALVAKPLATEPTIALDVNASGIKGGGLLAVLPALKPKIDAGGLKDGRFNTHLEASINYGRRGPRDFDIARGFTAEFDVKPVEFRATADGPVLAGVAAVHGEGLRVEPKTGNVTMKSLDVSTPTARIYRSAEGIHAGGLLLRLAAEQPVEALAPASVPSATPPPSAPAAAAARPANELRLDHFTVSGVDMTIEDRTSTPPTIVPLKSLDIDVRDLSNQLPWGGRPVRFSMLATSDKVALPPRKGASGDPSTQRASATAPYTEQRDLFAQVTANGQIGFVRVGDNFALDGWAKTAVNGFELLGVRGLAQQYGVTIGGGAFDDTNDVRFRPDGVIETKTRLVLTNLSLSEPADGPLRRLLKLPAPIDVAIGAVTDPDGSITMDLPVPIKNGTVTAGDVVGPALGAVTNVLVTGIASAPVKAIGGVGQLLGLGGDAAEPEPPVVVAFLPGYDAIDREAERQLKAIVEKMRRDETLELQLRHTLTDADVARTAVRANPPREQALALAEQVRAQKAALMARHSTLVAQARGDFGASASRRAEGTLSQLREVDVQIARAEDSLDALYALTAPGAAAQADRRTRAAALEIARLRLDAVRAAVVDAAPDGVNERVHQTNPQFDPAPATGGGEVVVSLVRKRK